MQNNLDKKQSVSLCFVTGIHMAPLHNSKECTKCKTEKSLSEFRNDKTRKDGLSCWCRECLNKQYREYSSKLEVKMRKQNWEEVNVEKRKKCRIERYYKNIGKERKKSRVYRKNNIKKCLEAVKRHYRNNRERYLEKNTRRKRKLKWIKLMDNPFPKEIEIDWHHINGMIVLPLPRKTHKKTLGLKHVELANMELNRIFGINFMKLLIP